MRNTIFILTLIIAGCATKKHAQDDQAANKYSSIIEVNIVEGKDMSFVIVNTSKEPVYIYQPKNIYLEKFDNGSWEHLRILYCPCGAPCAKPPENVEILMDGKYTWTWDKHESWCGEKNEFGIPETIKKIASNGKYRLRVLYRNSNNQKEVLYKEFELK